MFSCISSNNQDGYEVSLGTDDMKYVPTTSDQTDDKAYMNEINDLIEEKAAAVYNNPDFINIIKSIAWTETRWKHYFEKDSKYYVVLGDSGHSFGIMQIDDSYHGQHPILQDNIEYGSSFAYEKFQTARSSDCPSGSNSGVSIAAIARRTYAQYNGGNGAMCRENDARDDSVENALTNLIWNNYL
jgi:hypothetical protein